MIRSEWEFWGVVVSLGVWWCVYGSVVCTGWGGFPLLFELRRSSWAPREEMVSRSEK